MLRNYSSSDETHTWCRSVHILLPCFFLAKAHSLALASFYAGIFGVPDRQILDYWSFTVCGAICYNRKRMAPNFSPKHL
jgi:hypothetical protein